MSQNVPLNKDDVAIAPFFDATQELLSASAPYFVITVLNSTTLQIVGNTGTGQQAIAIGPGLYRYRTTSIQAAHPGGVAGTYPVFVTTAANNFTGQQPNIDLTNYAFGFEIDAIGATPTTTYYRQVGEVDWSGTAITAFRQWLGTRQDTASTSPTAPLPGIVAERHIRAASGTAPIATFESPTAVLASVTADGHVDSSQGFTVGGVALASTNLSDSAALARLASPALTGNPTGPTPAVDDNDTSLATTAFVLGQASAASPTMAGTAAAGTATRWARGDHVHPADTSRVQGMNAAGQKVRAGQTTVVAAVQAGIQAFNIPFTAWGTTHIAFVAVVWPTTTTTGFTWGGAIQTGLGQGTVNFYNTSTAQNITVSWISFGV